MARAFVLPTYNRIEAPSTLPRYPHPRTFYPPFRLSRGHDVSQDIIPDTHRVVFAHIHVYMQYVCDIVLLLYYACNYRLRTYYKPCVMNNDIILYRPILLTRNTRRSSKTFREHFLHWLIKLTIFILFSLAALQNNLIL